MESAEAKLPLDPDFKPTLGTYIYDVFWQGSRIGKAMISIEQEGDLYKISVNAKTNSTLSMLYKFRYKGEVKVEPSPFKPIEASVEEDSGRKKKNIEIQFPQTDRAESIEVKNRRRQDQISETENRNLRVFSGRPVFRHFSGKASRMASGYGRGFRGIYREKKNTN